MTCPNKNTEEYKALEKAIGSELAHYLWSKYEGEIPSNLIKNHVSDAHKDFYKEEVDPQKVSLQSVKDSIDRVKFVEENGHVVDYEVDGERGYTRVTKASKEGQKDAFKNRIPTKVEKATWAMDRVVGTYIHRVSSTILKKHFPEANEHIKPLTEREKSVDNYEDIYKAIETTLMPFIKTAKLKGNILVSEVPIADTKTKVVGTSDIVSIDPAGNKDIYDFKTLMSLKDANNKIQEWSLQLGVGYSRILSSENNTLGIKQDPSKKRVLPILRNYNKEARAVLTDALIPLTNRNERDIPDELLDPYFEKIIESINFVQVASKFHKKEIIEIPILTEKTNKPHLNKYIRELINQVNINKKKLARAPQDQKDAIKKSINTKLELIRKLQLGESVKDISIVATKDLKTIEDAIESGAYDPAMQGEDYLGTVKLYANISDFYDNEDFKNMTKEQKEYLDSLAGYASRLQTALTRIRLKHIQESIKNNTDIIGKGEIHSVEDLDIETNPVKESSWWKTMFLGISKSTHPILVGIKKLYDRGMWEARQKSSVLKTTLVQHIDAIKAFQGSSSIDWNPFLQEDEDGKVNGKMVSEVNHQFWEDMRDARSAENAAWFKENTELDYDKYDAWYKRKKESIDRLKPNIEKSLINKYSHIKNMTEAERKARIKLDLDKIINEKMEEFTKSYGTKTNPDMYIFFKPKLINDKYKDKKYQQMIQVKEYRDFYEFYKKTIGDLSASIPGYELRSDFIANFQASMVEKASRMGFSKAMAKKEWFSWDSIVVDHDPKDFQVQTLNHNILNEIPIEGLASLRDNFGKRLSVEDKSYNLALVLQRFADSVYKYEELSAIEGTALMARDFIAETNNIQVDSNGNPILTEEGEKKPWFSKKGNNDYNQLNAFVNIAWYGKKSEEDQHIITINDTKVTRALGLVKKDADGKYHPTKISLLKFGDNIIKYIAMKNLGLNMFSPGVNIAQGSLAAWSYAISGRYYNKKDYALAHKDMLTFDNKTRLLTKYFNITAHEFTERMQKDFALGLEKVLDTDNLLYLQEIGESFAQNSVLIAMLRSGKHGITMDDFDIVDGELKLTNKAITKEDLIAFENKVLGVTHELIGNYESIDGMLVKQSFLGRLLMQHRTWIPAMLQSRIGADEYDYELNQRIIVRYTMLFKKAGWQAFHIYAKSGFGFLSNKEELKKVDEKYISGIRTNMAEMLILVLVWALAHGLLDDDDPKDDTGIQRYAKRTAGRLLTELTFFMNPLSTLEIMRTPVTAMPIFQDIEKLMKHTKKAFWEGDKKAKPGKYLRRFIIPVGQVERFIEQAVTMSEEGYTYGF